MKRRFFLKLAGTLAFLTCIPGKVQSYFVKRLGVRTVETDDFRFDPSTGLINRRDRKEKGTPYNLVVDGLVEKPLKLTYENLKSLPQVTQVSDFHCVEGWSVADIRWGGFRFREIVNRAKPNRSARYVIFHALGETASRPDVEEHYTESLPLSALLDPKKECLLALSMDGKPLAHDHGAPLRVISPYDLGYKSIKYVTRIEFVETSKPGWWTLANPIYPVDAPVPLSRLRKGR